MCSVALYYEEYLNLSTTPPPCLSPYHPSLHVALLIILFSTPSIVVSLLTVAGTMIVLFGKGSWSCFPIITIRKPWLGSFTVYHSRSFIKGQAPSKLTSCDDDCACLGFLINKFSLKRFVCLWKPVTLLLKLLMKPLPVACER